MGDKALEEKPTGHVDQQKGTNQGVCSITVIGWNDNCAVYIAYNILPSQRTKLVCHWNNIDQKYSQVPQSNQFYCYNQVMVFADRMDESIAKYCTGIRMSKWWWAPFVWILDVYPQNF